MKLNKIPIGILVFSIMFNGLYIAHLGSNLKSFYIFLLISFSFIIYIKKNLEIQTHHFLIPFFLFIVGTINCIYGNTTFLKVFFLSSAIFLCMVIFYNAFMIFFDFKKNTSKVFAKFYTDMMAIYTLISLLYFFFIKSLSDDPQIRLYGLLAEPSILCIVIMPGIIYSFKNIIYDNKLNFYYIILSSLFLIAIYESKSTLGYFGIACLPIFLINKIKSKIILVIILAIFSLVLLNISSQISSKLNELIIFFSEGHLYTFAGPTSVTFFINFVVALKSFISNPVFGNGLGSHAISYFENVFSIPGSYSYPTNIYIGLNFNDANSLFFRIISETGLIGLILLSYFFIKFYTPNIYSNMSLILISLMLVRQGNFINPEFFLFTYYYYFNYKDYKNEDH